MYVMYILETRERYVMYIKETRKSVSDPLVMQH